MIKIYFEDLIDPNLESEIFKRRILSDYLKVNKDELNIKKNKYGKPFLVDYNDLHFNVTHTKDMIVGAISDKPIGIDMERIKPSNKGIAEKFFMRNEVNYIFHKKDNQDIRYLEVWTRKEAYVKWKGKGMEIPFDTFDVLREDRISTTFIKEYVFSICSNYMIDLNDYKKVNFYFRDNFI